MLEIVGSVRQSHEATGPCLAFLLCGHLERKDKKFMKSLTIPEVLTVLFWASFDQYCASRSHRDVYECKLSSSLTSSFGVEKAS